MTARAQDQVAGSASPGVAAEVATWRPVEVVDVDGWRVGFADGFTRRANSVVPADCPTDVEAAIARVEALYGARGLPARFRVCAAARPDDLDARLAALGYRAAATTHVLTRDVTAPATVPTTAPTTAPTILTTIPTTIPTMTFEASGLPDDDWLTGWLDVKSAGTAVDVELARAVVAASAAVYVTARDRSGVVGVIRAASVGPWVGLSCLMVAPRARRRGLARALTAVALAEAAKTGIRWAFLQVEEGNAPARELYAGMGFRRAETYHYRELDHSRVERS